MESAIFLEADEPGQGRLFAQTATLTEAFFQQLTRHPVPLEESAIRAIANNSMALDVYAWLAYRLHVLVKSTPVSWHSLKKQFGCGFARMDNFRVSFQGSLRLALAVYRDARVSVEDAGLVLHPSRPPVPTKQGVIRAS